MYVKLSTLRKVVAEQAQILFNELREDTDRLRRGTQDNWPGENHDTYEEDFEFEAKQKENEEEQESEEPKKSKEKSEKEPVEQQSPKHKKVKKGLEKAQKKKVLPKAQVNPKTGVKQDLDLDQLAQLATEMGYNLEKKKPEEDVPMDDLDGCDGIPGDDVDDLHPHQSVDDVESEDVAIVSSDEDLEDVMDLGHDEDVEDEGMRLDIEGHPLSMKKAATILRHGEVKDHPLSNKQKKFMGFVAGGGKPTKVR